MRPRVVVLIPCHDDGVFAEEAVASIREGEPVEIVVVDDASSDPGTQGALARLEAAGVRVLRQALNQGPGAARNAGLAASAAPYIYPLDADDLLAEGALGALADALDAAPDAAFAWGDYELFGDYDGRYRSPGAFLPWSLTYVNQYPVSSLIRRDALERLGGWHDVLYEDWDLWLGVAGMGLDGVKVPRVVYRRRLHGPARRLQGARRRHQEEYARLKARHPEVFGRRRELRLQEGPASWKRIVYPVLFGRRAVVPLRVEAWMQRVMMRRGLRLSR